MGAGPKLDPRLQIEERLQAERGTLGLGRPAPVCMAYPSPYRVGMSSLGFQTLYRLLNEAGIGAHRAFLPDPWEPASLVWPQPKQPILSYESRRPVSSYRILGLSVAYELELAGVIRLLDGAGIPILAADRGPHDPIVVGGGPLTSSNAAGLLPFVDLLIGGEAEAELLDVVRTLLETPGRDAAIVAGARHAHTVAGQRDPDNLDLPLPGSATAPADSLPAYSAITTPHTELSDMFLVEPERGCSRRCTFCVMRGPTTGGMRLLDQTVPLSVIPEHARRVGLVGAAVTDHPKLEELVASIVESGRGLGISSLRADRLTPRLVENLNRGGYRQITVASDGISQRLRDGLHRKIDEQSLLNAAQLIADQPGVSGMKLYQMIGVPGEDERDVDELIGFVGELAKITAVTLTISTFVAKRNTPMDGQAFIGVKQARQRLARIDRGLAGRVTIRPQSPRWAHVEYLVAQRGAEAGHAALAATKAGGRYRDWVRAFEALPVHDRSLVFGDEEIWARRKGRAAQGDRRWLPVVRSSSEG